MTTLIQIKRLLIDGKYRFTEKADLEIRREGLTRYLVIEAILRAPAIYKRIVSHDPYTGEREYLYIIVGQTDSGLVVYTKGKIIKRNGIEEFYLLISSKRDIDG